jgi:hypothetical protein
MVLVMSVVIHPPVTPDDTTVHIEVAMVVIEAGIVVMLGEVVVDKLSVVTVPSRVAVGVVIHTDILATTVGAANELC